MGDVRVGEMLMGADGKPVRVVAATEIMRDRPCYAVHFSDGEVIVADAEHQWVTWDIGACKAFDVARPQPALALPDDRWTWTSGGIGPCAKTTREIADSLLVRGECNHAVPVAAPIGGADADLRIDPWVLGYLLGQGDITGSGRVACDPAQREWIMKSSIDLGCMRSRRCRATPATYACGGVEASSSSVNTGSTTESSFHRITCEARSSRGFPWSRGWLDSNLDSRRRSRLHSYICSTSVGNERLVSAFRELVASIGCVSRSPCRSRSRPEPQSRPSWDVVVPSTSALARMTDKAVAVRARPAREQQLRYIVDVRPVETVPVRCVQIDNPDHLYLAGRSMVPTHNSTLALDVARNASVKHRLTSVIFSLEMSKTEITMRLLSAEAQIRLAAMRAGSMTEQDWQKIVRRMSEISDAPLFIDDSPNMTMMEIRAKARRLKQRNDLKLIVVDYLQLMSLRQERGRSHASMRSRNSPGR